MEDKDTSNQTSPKEKPVKIEPTYKPKTYTWEEFRQLFKNGINT